MVRLIPPARTSTEFKVPLHKMQSRNVKKKKKLANKFSITFYPVITCNKNRNELEQVCKYNVCLYGNINTFIMYNIDVF
jgi:hypothetical protein